MSKVIKDFLKDNNMGGMLVYSKREFLVYRVFELNNETDEDSYAIFYDDELVTECDTKQLAINMIEQFIKEMN